MLITKYTQNFTCLDTVVDRHHIGSPHIFSYSIKSDLTEGTYIFKIY